MRAKRIIPCMDIRNGRVVKGKNFTGITDVDDPVALAEFYNNSGADELVFYDITASNEDRQLHLDLLKQVISKITIPLAVGGGIKTVEDFDQIMKVGASKVSINSGALLNPSLITQASEKYGKQAVVFAMDVQRVNDQFHVFSKGGTTDTGIDAIEWAVKGEELGAGELVINSIDTDGVKQGFDLELLQKIADRVSIPIVASGGAGKKEDFKEVFKIKGVDAGLAASIFHYKEVIISDLKEYLKKNA